MHCEMLVFLSPPQVFGLLFPFEKCFKNCYLSSETTTRQPSFDRTFDDWSPAFLIYKFCISDELASLSLRELSLIYWSYDVVVTFGLPDRALDTADPFFTKLKKMHRAAPLETFCLALIWHWKSSSLLRIRIWLLTLSRSSWILKRFDYFQVCMKI